MLTKVLEAIFTCVAYSVVATAASAKLPIFSAEVAKFCMPLPRLSINSGPILAFNSMSSNCAATGSPETATALFTAGLAGPSSSNSGYTLLQSTSFGVGSNAEIKKMMASVVKPIPIIQLAPSKSKILNIVPRITIAAPMP